MLPKTALVAACLVTSTVSAAPLAASSEPAAAQAARFAERHDLAHALGDGPTLSLARFTARFDFHVIAPEVVDRLVQWHLGARDLFHEAHERLAALSTSLAARLAAPPDLTILTTDPLAAMATSESSGFGWRDDPFHHDTRYHSGTDFHSKYGTPVLAAGDGRVTFCGRQGGYGNVIYVDHGGGITTRYAHLSRIEVKKDMALTAGEEIGKVGSTGRATGPHLHFEVRIDEHAVSPILAMQVADLQRTSPDQGHIAAYALSPELAAHALADVDRPHHAPSDAAKKQKSKQSESRPDRPSRAKRVVPQS
jgi:murein DD-endopeptidase MepM/ murein hydrolase activator NlpD